MQVALGEESDWADVPEDPASLLGYFDDEGWGDGLPIVPPTESRIRAFLERSDHDPNEVLGLMEPAGGEITTGRLAANAVMAGATPDSFSVILSAVAAMQRPEFNLRGVQSTTHPVAPLLVVHGPIVADLGVHGGAGLFGPGFRANATIGRALRLILRNIGGARPGERDRATQGQPSKFSYCMAENEDASPWAPYHVEEGGLSSDRSAVTVFGGENPHNVNDHVSTTAAGILETAASTIATMGSNSSYYTQGQVVVVLGPEHAQTVADDGYTRADVKAFLFERARLPLRQLKRGGMWGMEAWPRWIDRGDDDALVPVGRSADSFRVMVAGGEGKHSSAIPGFGASQCVTQEVAATWPKELRMTTGTTE